MKHRILSWLIMLAFLSAGHAMAQGYGDYDPYSYGSGGGDDESLPIYVAINVSMNSYGEDGLTTSHGAGLGIGWRFDDMWSAEFAMKDLGDTGPGAAGFDVINYELVGRAFWPLSGEKSGIYGKLGLVQHKIDVATPVGQVYVDGQPIESATIEGPEATEVVKSMTFDNTAYGAVFGVGYQIFSASKNSGFFVEMLFYSISENVERDYTYEDSNTLTTYSYTFDTDVEAGLTSINVGVIF